MKELKLKAYDKLRKKVCKVLAIDFEKGNCKILYDNESDWVETKELYKNIIRLKDAELIEYTGVHDKNGKEIYEGDIVKWKEFLEEDNHIIKNDEIFGVIEFEKGSFEVNQLNKGRYSVLIHDDIEAEHETTFYETFGCDTSNFLWEDLEIIGNKYGNPELLKRKE